MESGGSAEIPALTAPIQQKQNKMLFLTQRMTVS